MVDVSDIMEVFPNSEVQNHLDHTDKTMDHHGRVTRVFSAPGDNEVGVDTRKASKGSYFALCQVAKNRGYRIGWAYHRFVKLYCWQPPQAWLAEFKKEYACGRRWRVDE